MIKLDDDRFVLLYKWNCGFVIQDNITGKKLIEYDDFLKVLNELDNELCMCKKERFKDALNELDVRMV